MTDTRTKSAFYAVLVAALFLGKPDRECRDNRILVSFDVALGPFPCVLLRKINKSSHVPVSLMSIHIAKFAHPIRPVRAVFWKALESKDRRYTKDKCLCRFHGFDENKLDKDLFL